MRGKGRVKAVALLALTAGLLVATTSAVQAELEASGNLFIRFDGGIEPEALPRDERAPVAVWISGLVRTLSGEQPPSLRKITIGLNRDGVLETDGLPICRKGQIDLASSDEALKTCRDALVGTGTYRARTTFPEQSQSPSHGKLLAFNSVIGGKEVILGHVHGDEPAPSTGIVVFDIKRQKGAFGTILTGTMPETLTRWGYLKRISLRLHREYTVGGERRSYLSAPCRAPKGLRQASFKFSYVEMLFDDGRELSAKLTRSCRVRGAS